MSHPLYIYVHGFNSSPQSFKARLFAKHLEALGLEGHFRVPELPHWPARAIGLLEQLAAEADGREILWVGSSLGGYYATYLVEHFGGRAVLVNPAVRPYELLSAWLGDNQNLYTAERYRLTERHLQQLLAIDCPTLADPGRYLLLTQTGDETLDYRQGVEKFRGAPQWVQSGGSHGFDRFEQVLPTILAFAQGEPLSFDTVQ